jgi:hypothetical protein
MSEAAITARKGVLTLDQWQIVFHEAMAAVLRTHEAIKKQFGIWGLAQGLWKSNRDLKALNKSLKAICELPDGVVNEAFVKSQIPQVRKLIESIDDLLETARRRGLMNRTLTGAALHSIGGHSDYIREYLDTLDMSLDPDVLAAIKDGRAQIDQGEFEILEPYT